MTTTNGPWLEEALRRIEQSGRRSGAARTAVLELFAAEGRCLLTPAQVIDHLRERATGSAASVYRVIDDLHGLGLLHRVDGSDGIARYEIEDPDNHHHHLVDEATGQVEPFADDDLERAIEQAAARLGVQLSGHDLVLRGRRAAPEPEPGR